MNVGVIPFQEGSTLEVEIHGAGRDVRSARRASAFIISAFKGIGEPGHDLVFHIEQVSRRLVEALGPDMAPVSVWVSWAFKR